jgi:hypothetical protein
MALLIADMDFDEESFVCSDSAIIEFIPSLVEILRLKLDMSLLLSEIGRQSSGRCDPLRDQTLIGVKRAI